MPVETRNGGKMERDFATPKEKSLYLAGPFFNAPQVETIEKVESLCETIGLNCNSPRKFMVLKPDASLVERRATFLDNIQKIQESQIVFACIDNPRDVNGAMVDTPPDIGTVWEIGYAYGIGRPVVCFTLRQRKMNVMLAQGCAGFLSNEVDIEAFLQGKEVQTIGFNIWDFNWEIAEAWNKEVF